MYDSKDFTQGKDDDDDSGRPTLNHSSIADSSMSTGCTNVEINSIGVPTVAISENSLVSDSCVTTEGCSKS